jgi:hypothetical protein
MLRRHFQRHGEWWWVPILYTLAVIWIYRDLWHQNGHATGLGWDTIDSHGPDLDLQAAELADGKWPLWNPWDKGGYPLVSDPTFDRYYPFNWPFVAWGAVFGTSWWLVQIKVLAHHVVAACMMHVFVRSRGLSVRAAITAGFGLVASAPLLVHKASNILWPLAWVPLVWLAIDFALAKPTWRRGAALAAAFLPCATAGSPPGLFYAALLIGPYGVWRLANALRDRQRRKKRALIDLAICGATAAIAIVLVVAVVTVIAQPLVEAGSRWRWQPPEEFPLALSQPWRDVVRGVFARGAGLGEMYMGSAIVLLALCAMVLRPRCDRGIAIVFAAIAAFGIVLAAGDTTPVLPWLVHHLPGFGLLRIPNRYKLVAAWALVAAAAYGVAALEQATREQRIRATVCAIVALGAIVLFVERWPTPETFARPAWWSIVAMAIAAALVIATALAPAAWKWAATSALAIAALVDAPTFTHTPQAPPVSDPRQLHERDDEILARLSGVRDRWRLYDEFILGERVGTRRQVRDFRGYPSVDPLSQWRYVDVLDFARTEPRILPEFNVRWILSGLHFRHADQFKHPRMPHPDFVDRGDGVWEALNPAPLVMWYGAVSVVKSNQVMPEMVKVGYEGRRRAVIEPDVAARLPVALQTAAAAGKPGDLDRYDPDEIAVTVDVPRDGLVVLNELGFPGWEVEVDGTPADPLRANYMMRAVYVTAGRHQIVWSFHPAHYRLLLDGYLAALTLMLVAFATRKRSPPPARVVAGHPSRSNRRADAPRS